MLKKVDPAASVTNCGAPSPQLITNDRVSLAPKSAIVPVTVARLPSLMFAGLITTLLNVGAGAEAATGAKATPRNAVLAPAVIRMFGEPLMFALNAAVSVILIRVLPALVLLVA